MIRTCLEINGKARTGLHLKIEKNGIFPVDMRTTRYSSASSTLHDKNMQYILSWKIIFKIRCVLSYVSGKKL